jgi:5-amino-6-(5-phosphoribosylamino)uracil reductase
MSVDGRIDDSGPDRLILSSDEDADRVDEVRAGVDAILVGAGTIRRDDPRLVIRSRERRSDRIARGLPEDPVKVTITATGDLDPAARFFTTGSAPRLVYCARPALAATRARLSGLAEVIDAGDWPSPVLILFDLAERGVASVLLEGGGQLASEFLSAGLADELHLVIAPFFVGDPDAPRFADPGGYPHGPGNRMQLAEVRRLGGVVLLRYLLGDRHPAEPPADEASRPADPPGSDPHPSFPLATPAPGPADVAGPDSPPVALVPRPARSPEPAIPRAADIHWLRETIELLSAEDPEPPQPPAPYGDQPPAGQPHGNQAAIDVPYRDRARGGRPDNDLSNSGRPDRGGPPAPEQSFGAGADPGQSHGGGPDRDPFSSGRPQREQPYGGEPVRQQPYGAPPDRDQSYGGEPNRAQSYGSPPGRRDQSYGQQPAGPSAADLHWLRQAIELSKRCPPSQTAFSVGCVIVAADGRPLATGFSRETDPRDHAEEAALGKLARGDPRLAGAALYSSLEPCGVRASRPRPCAELIIAAGIPRVVYAWREPPLLATGGGDRRLRSAGVSVTEVPELAAQARQVNAHLTGP